MECELLTKNYKALEIVPSAEGDAGEIIKSGDTFGFLMVDYDATMLGAGSIATLITDAERCKVVKQTGETWVAGQNIYFLAASSDFTNVYEDGAVYVGKALRAAANAAVVGYVSFQEMNPPILNLESDVTAGMIRAGSISLSLTGASATKTVEVLKVEAKSDVQEGDWINALFGRLSLETDGYVTGLASAVCAELALPGSAIPGGSGTYWAWETEINCPTGFVAGGVPLAVMGISVWGAAKTQFDDNGYLFDISGVTSGAADFLYVHTVGVVDAFLKCRINGTPYYLLLAADQS